VVIHVIVILYEIMLILDISIFSELILEPDTVACKGATRRRG